jgi:hypothetical protein
MFGYGRSTKRRARQESQPREASQGRQRACTPARQESAIGREETSPRGRKNVSIKAGEPTKPEQKSDPTQLEKSLALVAKLRELEFHSRANIEKLAELSLTIEDELKQKGFVEPIGDVYSAQEAFHSKISALIESYQAECDRLKPAG